MIARRYAAHGIVLITASSRSAAVPPGYVERCRFRVDRRPVIIYVPSPTSEPPLTPRAGAKPAARLPHLLPSRAPVTSAPLIAEETLAHAPVQARSIEGLSPHQADPVERFAR